MLIVTRGQITDFVGINDEGTANIRAVVLVPQSKRHQEDALVGNVVFGRLRRVFQIISGFGGS